MVGVVARLSAALTVGALVVVLGVAGGRGLNAIRQAPEPSFEPFAAPPAASGTGALALPVQCDAPIPASTGTYSDLAWSADSGTLAATTAAPGEPPTRISLFYGSDWKAHDIGAGRGPRWSPAGLLAFERSDRYGTLRIVDARSGREVGQVADTVGAYAWDGEVLVFFRGNELRAWQDGTEELRAVVGSAYVPAKPYLARFSGDGSRFVVERRENREIAELFMGDTKDGRASPLSTPLAYSFAPAGSRLILDYADRWTLFAEAKGASTIAKTDIAGPFAGWSPDGRRALFRTTSGALLGWDVMRVDEVARTATGSGATVFFAPNGRWLASLTNGSVTFAPCSDLGADPRVKLKRDEVIQTVRSRPDVLSVTKIEAKLVLWTELERNHAKGMFPAFGTADATAPVWLVGVAGEVRRPPSWNPPFALPTYSLGLFALDASDGHELAAQVTNGTWWIGDGFDDLHEYGTLPPAWMPPPGAFATPANPIEYTVTPAGANVEITSNAGWMVSVPREWFLTPGGNRFGGAVVSNYDQGIGSYTSIASLFSAARLRLSFELWSNDQRLSLGEWVDQAFKDGMTTHVTDRAMTTLAGRQAEVLTKEESFGPPPLGQQKNRIWIVPATDESMLVVFALPADSTAIGEAERVLRTLRLPAPTPAPKAMVARADAINTATQTLTTSPTGKPQPPIRIDRIEAKLVRSIDLRSIVGPFQGWSPGPLDKAPGDPVWVVAIAGDLGMTSGICRGPAACQPQAIGWTAVFVDARTGAVRSSLTGPSGAWPAFFDPLPDRPL